MYRFEKKFSTSENNLSQIFALIKFHPAGFSELYRERIVNSIYFDSPDFNMYSDSINGALSRKKFRLRWYGSENSINSFLEVKKKEGEKGSKERFKLNPILKTDKITSEFIVNLIEMSKVKDNQILNFFNYYPVLLCTYKRRYFLSSNKSIRLTVDYEIGYSPFSYNYSISECRAIFDSSLILEYKYPYFIDKSFLINLDILPLRQTRFSKYSNGVELLYL